MFKLEGPRKTKTPLELRRLADFNEKGAKEKEDESNSPAVPTGDEAASQNDSLNVSLPESDTDDNVGENHQVTSEPAVIKMAEAQEILEEERVIQAYNLEDTLVEFKDMLEDYDPDSLTVVDLTEFTARLAEIRSKLNETRKFLRTAQKSIGADDVERDKPIIENLIKKAIIHLDNITRRPKSRTPHNSTSYS